MSMPEAVGETQRTLTMVEALRAHRESDPDDEKAIAAFAKAELTHPDPLEGKIVTIRRTTRASRAKVRPRAHA